MIKLLSRWPLMLKSTHEATRRENWELRGALTAANAELRKHRLLIGGLRSGAIDLTDKIKQKV
jgi:hypothetical protein